MKSPAHHRAKLASNTKTPASPSFHFFMISGVILFSQGEAPQNIETGTAYANAIVRHTDKTFPARKLGTAQQNILRGFTMKMPPEALASFIAHDIILTNISYLGQMTEDEFQAKEPEPEAKAPAVISEQI